MEISVVVPTFNRADVLRRSLESVLAQTLLPAEIVVVDDASTDGTDGVIGEIGSELVRYVRLPARSGSQAARNHGIREARGNWIAFQDSDDEWLPDKLERQVAVLAEHDFDPWTVVHGSGVSDGRALPHRLEGAADAREALLRGPASLFPALLVSREALERIGPLDEQIDSYQEWDTSLRLAAYCRFVSPAQPVFVWHRTAGAISESHAADIRGYEQVIEKHRSEMDDSTWDAHIRFVARRALEFGFWDEARRLLRSATSRDARWYAYAILARLHARPSWLFRLARGLRARGSERSSFESYVEQIEDGAVSLGEALSRAGPYPAEMLAGRESGLLLFGAAFLGINDAVHFFNARISDVTVVDIDKARLDTMRALYPATWKFVEADAFAFAEKQRAAGTEYDVVSADPFTDLMPRLRTELPTFCALARRAVVFGIEHGQPLDPPEGWCARRVERTGLADWVVLERQA